jgi:hypothetical protein
MIYAFNEKLGVSKNDTRPMITPNNTQKFDLLGHYLNGCYWVYYW